MKTFIFCLMLIAASLRQFAQNGNGAAPLTFSLRPVATIIVPGDVLFSGFGNKITVAHAFAAGSTTLLSSDGTLLRFSEEKFVLNKVVAQTITLTLVTTGNKKNPLILATKVCKVMPYPRIKMNGVASDSAIDCLMLASGTFYAELGPKRKYALSGFKMEMLINNKFVADSARGGRLTPSMLRYVATLKPGAVLLFRDLEIDLGNGLSKTEAIYRVYLVAGNYSQTSMDL